MFLEVFVFPDPFVSRDVVHHQALYPQCVILDPSVPLGVDEERPGGVGVGATFAAVDRKLQVLGDNLALARGGSSRDHPIGALEKRGQKARGGPLTGSIFKTVAPL